MNFVRKGKKLICTYIVVISFCDADEKLWTICRTGNAIVAQRQQSEDDRAYRRE